MNTNLLLLLGLGFLGYSYFKNNNTAGNNTGGNTTGLTTDQMKQQLTDFAIQYPDASLFLTAIYQMTAAEIASTWDYIFHYWTKNIELLPGTQLYNEIMAISAKYNIFN